MLYSIHLGRVIGTDILPSKFQVYQLVKQKKAIAFRAKGLMIAEDKGLSQWKRNPCSTGFRNKWMQQCQTQDAAYTSKLLLSIWPVRCSVSKGSCGFVHMIVVNWIAWSAWYSTSTNKKFYHGQFSLSYKPSLPWHWLTGCSLNHVTRVALQGSLLPHGLRLLLNAGIFIGCIFSVSFRLDQNWRWSWGAWWRWRELAINMMILGQDGNWNRRIRRMTIPLLMWY